MFIAPPSPEGATPTRITTWSYRSTFRRVRSRAIGVVIALLLMLVGASTGVAAATVPVPAHITSSPPPDAVYGQPYTFTFTASGDPAPHFVIQTGRLPYGLTFDWSTGVLGGTPKELGSFPITLIASNGYETDAPTAYTLNVTGTAATITNTPPPAGVNTPYWFSFTDTGNPTPNYTLEGTLPAGLAFYNNGVIAGYPTALDPGTPLSVTATNGVDPAGQLTFTLPVVPAAPHITTASVPDGTVGSNYYARIYAQNGTAPNSMSLAPGSVLPDGLTFNSWGEIMGTPTTPGTTTFTVVAASGDAVPVTSSKDFTLTISPKPLSITTTVLPEALSGLPYSTTLTATGGSGGYTFAPTPGTTLPAGLLLDATGLLHGTPSGSGLESLSVQVTDSSVPATTATAVLPLTIFSLDPPAPPDLSVTLTNVQKFVTGSNGTYRMHVLNVGSFPSARSARLTLALPVGLTFGSVASPGWSCQHTIRSVTCTHAAALLPGADSVLSVVVHVLARAGTRLVSRVAVTPSDINNGDNTAANTVQTVRP